MATGQIKQDVNRSEGDKSNLPSICERCLPDEKMIRMLARKNDVECKICTRPFTSCAYRGRNERHTRERHVNICLTCSRLKNCCQRCMRDLNYGLAPEIRDAALKMIAPGPQSDVNRQYYAQEHEREIEDGRGAIEVYDNIDDKARDFLRRIAQTETFSKKRQRQEAEEEESNKKSRSTPGGLAANSSSATNGSAGHIPGPIRTRDSKATFNGRVGGPGRGGHMGGLAAASNLKDWVPPSDPNIVSLFLTGVEDDLPDDEIKKYFEQYGKLRSVVSSHRAHCAYVNYGKRADAEKAAETLQGKVVIKGCPMRVQWGKPKQLDSLDQNVRMQYAREGRLAARRVRQVATTQAATDSAPQDLNNTIIAPPPGADDETSYASLRGD